ncbi:hypothetical protein V6N12_009104 [Hibiscus sabdariffa]|uniref:Malectin-like domain-containing protein n=1 Tax=Hibiscus sabdariffa TaxID=183260 RepID=A0ABR2C4P6_9ROSI
MFWYGNYDGLSKPSTFDLEFDGNKWATVVTNMNNFTYYEMIYATKGDSISICLARTQDQQFPFISRLESIPVPDEMYPQMRRNMAWFNSYRYDYGASDRILGYPDDPYNRIWEPSVPPGLKPVTANFTSIDVTSVNDPPDSAIITAVEAQSSADTIDLSFGFGNISHLDHVEMYFTEPFLQTGETRSFSVIVNNSYVNTTNPEYQNCVSIGANSLSIGTLNVQLVPTNESTLPPIISAIEVYTVSEPLVTATTSQNDCKAHFTLYFFTPKSICTDDQPPRVTAICLSEYGLQGYLPDFSQMDALEVIDMHNNTLDGEIPDFLGKLPNLRILDLRDNDFSGYVPRTITDNKQLEFK